MKTMRGPAMFLAQSASGEAPFIPVYAMAIWAASLGFVRVHAA